MELLVTAFTGFGAFAVNPSVAVGQGVCAGLRGEGGEVGFEEVEVSFGAVEGLVERLRAGPPRRWLMLGVAGTAAVPRVERVARNAVGGLADVRGVVRGPGRIEAGGEEVEGRLFEGVATPGGAVDSRDAGDYLCNFVYWMGQTRLETRCGFVHVVPEGRMEVGRQVEVVGEVLRRTEGRGGVV